MAREGGAARVTRACGSVVPPASALLLVMTAAGSASALEATAQRGGWTAYASAGVPRLESTDFAVDGDLRLGYSGSRFGGWARGRVATYDVVQESPRREQTNVSSEAEGQAWGTPIMMEGFSVSAGLDAGFYQYSADSLVAAPVATSVEDTSQIVRLGAVVTARISPRSDLELMASLLGGGQREAYIQTTVQATGNLQDLDERRTSAWGSGRFAGNWRFLPDVLSAAVRINAHVMRLNRANVFLGFSPATGVTQSDRQLSATRVDLLSRAEIGFDVAKFVGILPFLYGQLEWIRESGGGATSTTAVPSAGLGMKTEAL